MVLSRKRYGKKLVRFCGYPKAHATITRTYSYYVVGHIVCVGVTTRYDLYVVEGPDAISRLKRDVASAPSSDTDTARLFALPRRSLSATGVVFLKIEQLFSLVLWSQNHALGDAFQLRLRC